MLTVASTLQITDGSLPWQSLSIWLRYFFQLGQRVAAAREAGAKTCAVVIPPVRSFAGVFAAIGAVVGVAMTAEQVPDVESHFATLSSLDHGTPLVVKMGERIYAAKFCGIVIRNGTAFVKIEYGGMTQYLPKQECQRAQIGLGGKRTLPKSLHRSGSGSVGVIESLLGVRASEFLSVPAVDVVLLGKVSLLQQELTSISIRSATTHAASAPLGSLLRPSRFLPDGGIHRSLLLSDRVLEFDMPVKDVPHVAIFDGARAFCRHRSRFQESSWIAVFDRCSATFREGVDVANQEFATRCGMAPYLNDLEIPPGTEAQTLERGR